MADSSGQPVQGKHITVQCLLFSFAEALLEAGLTIPLLAFQQEMCPAGPNKATLLESFCLEMTIYCNT